MASRKPMRDRDDVMSPRDPNKRYPAYNVQPQKPKAKKIAKKAQNPARFAEDMKRSAARQKRKSAMAAKPKAANKLRTR